MCKLHVYIYIYIHIYIYIYVQSHRESGGNHLSNTTCPMQVFFQSGE